ncbi:hypothetical protein MIR68_002140 [Amoeboaphelidium protococcarum]|nr:hypothetical protein MIR68_002140 [Amoeboaphelidium protococcarum]
MEESAQQKKRKSVGAPRGRKSSIPPPVSSSLLRKSQNIKKIIYGSFSQKIDSSKNIQSHDNNKDVKQKNIVLKSDVPEGHTHKWKLFIQPHEDDDHFGYISHVTFHLHPSFNQPKRVITNPPFEVIESGWGEFESIIELHFKDKRLKSVKLPHMLKLYQFDQQTGKQLAVTAMDGSTQEEQNSTDLEQQQQQQEQSTDVLYERYEELVFVDPPEESEHQQQKDGGGYKDIKRLKCIQSEINEQTEDTEQVQLNRALEKVKEQVKEWTQRRDDLLEQVTLQNSSQQKGNLLSRSTSNNNALGGSSDTLQKRVVRTDITDVVDL